MKTVVLLFIMVLLSANLAAQPKAGSGAVGALPARADTAYVDDLNKRSIEMYLRDPDSARALAEKALILAKQLHYNRGTGTSYAATGYTYWAQSYYSLSLYYLFNALEYLKAVNEYAGLSMCYRMVARNYIDLEKFNLAGLYLKEAKKAADISKDNFTIELVYNESSSLDMHLGNYDKAWATASTALALSSKNRDTLLKGIIYSRLADILGKTRKPMLAKTYFDSALTWSKLARNNRLKALLFNDYAQYYMAAGRSDSALVMAKAASNLADSIGNADLRLSAALFEAQAYKSSKDAAHELEYRRTYNALQDSIRTAEAKKSFMLLEQFLAMNKRLNAIEGRERENIISRERLNFQHVIIFVLIIFIVILLAGLFTIYYLYKEKKRLADQLAERNNAITDQKDIIERQSLHLAELNNLKTKLFAVISHDLRTPISSLRSIMGLFQQNDLSEKQAIALLKRMVPALDGADLTLSNLLNWSVKQMSGLKVIKSAVLILPMAEEVQRVFEFALQQKDIKLYININSGSKAWFDEQHLKIILRNLVSNAIKFTPQNGNIIIGEKSNALGVTIYVKDTGQGIQAADIAKLFVPTTHFTTRGTHGEKGTGLGLILCKELLELNEGSIYVESAPGEGSTFYIELREGEN